MNDLFLRACRRERTERPPVWMMRQAGRYLPEYRKVRERADFLTMVRTPELAVEVTLQPVDRLGVDAAIIFSDILVIPQAMGMTLVVDEGVGPQFPSPLRQPADFDRLLVVEPEESLGYMLEALRLARRALNGRVPLIGFAGAPWTLAAYMIEGGGSKNFARPKRLLAEDPARADRLLDRLAVAVGDFLVAQVRAGAEAVQLFDSWAGSLAPADYRRFALPALAKAARRAKEAGAPVIVFAPGAGELLGDLAAATGADVIGVDWHTEPAVARARLAAHPVAVQGNFDPTWLYTDPATIRRRAQAMITEFGGQSFIGNLGHGILPDVPVANALAFVRAVQEWQP
jgi:uroporphyrinogen decarboxylase